MVLDMTWSYKGKFIGSSIGNLECFSGKPSFFHKYELILNHSSQIVLNCRKYPNNYWPVDVKNRQNERFLFICTIIIALRDHKATLIIQKHLYGLCCFLVKMVCDNSQKFANQHSVCTQNVKLAHTMKSSLTISLWLVHHYFTKIFNWLIHHSNIGWHSDQGKIICVYWLIVQQDFFSMQGSVC